MKRLRFAWVAVLMAAMTMLTASCNDFFDTDPKDIINDNDIKEPDEMYKNFLGIISRMQEAGDQSIILTDTRCNIIETTENAPVALQNIYNFSNTEGNEYADPSCYYSIVIAANDFFDKMSRYHASVGGMSEQDETNFKSLLSMAIRLKVWAYLKLGSIYGQAYWFDAPVTDALNFSDASVFVKCDMGQIATRAIDLLNNGIDIDGVHITSDLNLNWATWFDEENQDETLYTKWYYMVPPRILLEAEMRAWRASYETEDAAQADWRWVRDNLLQYMHDIHTCSPSFKLTPAFDFTTISNSSDWKRAPNIYQLNAYLSSGVRDEYFPYQLIFPTEEVGIKYHCVSGIMYDYINNQKNRIVQYFCPEYPSAESYYLRPSEYGKSLYNEEDIRSYTQKIVMNNLGGNDCITKYYYYYERSATSYKYIRDNIFEIEPTIPTFRSHDFHFLIAEAENHLGNWKQANAILNDGVQSALPDRVLPEDWDPNYNSWLGTTLQTQKDENDKDVSQSGNGNIGIAGAARGKLHNLPTVDENGQIVYNELDANGNVISTRVISESERREIFDWELADEYLKEYVAEGKSYSFLCKIGERYANSTRGGNASTARSKFAARIAGNHTSAGGKVTSYNDGVSDLGYFIKWNLKN